MMQALGHNIVLAIVDDPQELPSGILLATTRPQGSASRAVRCLVQNIGVDVEHVEPGDEVLVAEGDPRIACFTHLGAEVLIGCEHVVLCKLVEAEVPA